MILFPRSLEEWYKPFTKEEKIWFALAIVVALILALTTLTWPLIDSKHQVPAKSYAIHPAEFEKLANEFAEKYKDKVVPEGVDIYIAARQWFFTPAKLILKSGIKYTIHISSIDVLHGFELIGENGIVYNLMIMPGMVYVFNVEFKTGNYEIHCNEYCGTLHHVMEMEIEVI